MQHVSTFTANNTSTATFNRKNSETKQLLLFKFSGFTQFKMLKVQLVSNDQNIFIDMYIYVYSSTEYKHTLSKEKLKYKVE